MTVIEIDGKWFVVQDVLAGDVLAGPFKTNTEAWRWVDRCEGSPISRGETVSQWLWDKAANGP
jgi:hypothetical protein